MEPRFNNCCLNGANLGQTRFMAACKFSSKEAIDVIYQALRSARGDTRINDVTNEVPGEVILTLDDGQGCRTFRLAVDAIQDLGAPECCVE